MAGWLNREQWSDSPGQWGTATRQYIPHNALEVACVTCEWVLLRSSAVHEPQEGGPMPSSRCQSQWERQKHLPDRNGGLIAIEDYFQCRMQTTPIHPSHFWENASRPYCKSTSLLNATYILSRPHSHSGPRRHSLCHLSTSVLMSRYNMSEHFVLAASASYPARLTNVIWVHILSSLIYLVPLDREAVFFFPNWTWPCNFRSLSMWFLHLPAECPLQISLASCLLLSLALSRTPKQEWLCSWPPVFHRLDCHLTVFCLSSCHHFLIFSDCVLNHANLN